MEIDFLILADAAQVAEGKLYLLGGGWDRMAVNVLPAVQTIGIAVGVAVPWAETNIPHTLRLTVEDDDGGTVLQPVDVRLEIGRPAGLAAGSDQRVTVAFNAHLGLSRLGGYVVTAALENGAQRRLRFSVTPGPQFRQEPGLRIEN
jgi:hypothetical protein